MDTEDIDILKDKIDKQAQDLHAAATIGKQLLEENGVLQTLFDDACKSHGDAIQKYEQEKYEMQMMKDLFLKKEVFYKEEIERYKESVLKNDHDEIDIQSKLNLQINDLSRQVTYFKGESESMQLAEKQYLEKIQFLGNTIEEMKKTAKLEVSTSNETFSDDVADLHSENVSLKEEMVEMQSRLKEASFSEEKLKLSLQNCNVKLESQKEEVEDLQSQISHYSCALEKSKEKNMELQVIMDQMKMASRNPKAKGNSLFAEVEDRRIVAEKELISLKTNNDTLSKQLELSQKQMSKIKLQIAHILDRADRSANDEYVQKLKGELCSARSEVDYLNKELLKNTHQRDEDSTNFDLKQKFAGENRSSFSDFVQVLLKEKDTDIESLQKKANTNTLLMHAETQRVIDAESKTHICKREISRLKSQILKYKTTMEELQIKYEPDKINQASKIQTRTEVLHFSDKENCEKDDTSILKEKIPSQKPDFSKSINHSQNSSWDVKMPILNTDEASLKGFSEYAKKCIREGEKKLKSQNIHIFSQAAVERFNTGASETSAPFHKTVESKKVSFSNNDESENLEDISNDKVKYHKENKKKTTYNSDKNPNKYVEIKPSADEDADCKTQ